MTTSPPVYITCDTQLTSQDNITLVIPNWSTTVKLLGAEQIIACCEQPSVNCSCTIDNVMTSFCSDNN